MTWPCSDCKEPVIGVAFGCDAAQDPATWDVKHILDPVVPCIEAIPDGLYYGRTIVLQSKACLYPKDFAINLITSIDDNRDVIFHFNPRYDRRLVVRNAKRKGVWGDEEISADAIFPFCNNRGFQLAIFVSTDKLMVAINNKHFCSFLLRSPIELCRLVQVQGDINVKSIHFSNADTYPALHSGRLPRIVLPSVHPDLSRPKFLLKRRVIAPGCTVTIVGRVKLLPQQFYINLQEGSSIIPHPVIPLHINLRLGYGLQDQQMIFNSWINGSWGHELKPPDCPFSPGMIFKMVIIYLEEGFHVSVNGEFLLAFPLRLPSPILLDTVLVQGDVIIKLVKVFSSTLKSVAT